MHRKSFSLSVNSILTFAHQKVHCGTQEMYVCGCIYICVCVFIHSQVYVCKHFLILLDPSVYDVMLKILTMGGKQHEKYRCGYLWEQTLDIGNLTASKPFSSDGKVSACNAGDLGSIPGPGRSPGEGNGNPLQYSCLENPMDGGAWGATVHGVAESRTQLSDFTHSLTQCISFKYLF